MPGPLLTLTQQEIDDELKTTRSNISLIEKPANYNIRLAKEALDYIYSLEATLVCTLSAESELTKEIFFDLQSRTPDRPKSSMMSRILTAVPEKILTVN